VLKVEGQFNVTGPIETFANAGGVHLAHAILAEFAENVAKLMAERARPTAPSPDPVTSVGERETAATAPEAEKSVMLPTSELRGDKILWRAFVSWLRDVFFGKRDAQ